MASKKHKLKAPRAARRASRLERFDAAVAHAASRYREHPVVRAAAIVSDLADQPPLLAGSVVTIAAGAALRRPRLLRAGARMLASELLATAIKGVIKHHVNRTRPAKMLEDGRYALHADRSGSKDEGPWNSFPSGHTAGAVAVGRAVTREFPGAGPAAAGAAAVVALVQTPKGAHFPSDVVAGGVVGLLSEALVERAARWIDRRSGGAA
jgi:membrane-associated phospholipid phosphatase